MTEPVNTYEAETEKLVQRIREVAEHFPFPEDADENERERRSRRLVAIIRAGILEAFEHLGLSDHPERITAFTNVVSQEINRQRRLIDIARKTAPNN